MLHVIIALGAILLPELVARRGLPDFRRLATHFLYSFISGTTIYWLFLGVFGEHILQILYAGKYLEYGNLLWLTGMIPIIGAIVSVSMVALQALELPNIIFRAYLASSGVAITIGPLCVIVWSVNGAMIGWLAAYAVNAIMMKFLLSTNLKSGNSTWNLKRIVS